MSNNQQQQTTSFEANIKLGTQKRTGEIKAKSKFACSGNTCIGSTVNFPLEFNPGEQQTSICSVQNINIRKGDRIDVEIVNPENGALIGTFTGQVTNPQSNNVIDCLIYKGPDQ